MPASDLPQRAASALERAIAIGVDTFEARPDVAEAFAAVGWPDPAPKVMPRADELTSEQRALVEALAAQPRVNLAFKGIANVRLAHWLGLAPAGILERLVPERGAPLWRVVRELEEARSPELGRFLATMPLADRLEAFGAVNAFGYERPYRLDAETFFSYKDRDLLASLRAEGASWAPTFADQVLTHDKTPREEIRWPVFLALVRARIPIEPRWDRLLPLGFGVYRELTDEVVEAIPPDRRDAAIIAALGKVNPWAVGVPLLDRFPSATLARALLDAKGGPPPALVKLLQPVAAKHAIVAQVLEAALASAPQPVALSVTRVLTPTSTKQLSPLEQAQLALAGQRWDGIAAPASERLARGDSETSFAGHVELRSLADADGEPAYDAWLYMTDSGTIFVAGTETVAAEIIQRGLECSDPALRHGLERVLFGGGSNTPAKKPAAKKPAAKQPATKKPATKKPATKKPATKKPSGKKRS